LRAFRQAATSQRLADKAQGRKDCEEGTEGSFSWRIVSTVGYLQAVPIPAEPETIDEALFESGFTLADSGLQLDLEIA
jgi:hypothetical protein